MRTLQTKVPHFQTFLTGGNAPYVLNNVRTSRNEERKLHYEKYLVLRGLNESLVYNKEVKE